MRAITTAIAVVVASLTLSEPSFSQTNSYSRCARLASQQGLNPNSTSGRRFINRCMRPGSYGQNYGPSRNCPEDTRTRSAYPAWMCP